MSEHRMEAQDVRIFPDNHIRHLHRESQIIWGFRLKPPIFGALATIAPKYNWAQLFAQEVFSSFNL